MSFSEFSQSDGLEGKVARLGIFFLPAQCPVTANHERFVGERWILPPNFVPENQADDVA
jgi:hypothetical protein